MDMTLDGRDRRLPPGAIPTKATHAALALVAGAGERWTVRRVAHAIHRSPTQTWGWLRMLRAEGLITWDDGRHGSLRAACRPVPINEEGIP